MSLNNCTFMGRWIKDVELKYLQSGQAMLTGVLAVNRERKGEADFINITIFGKLAENTDMYCGKKGDTLTIIGRLQSSVYTDKSGAKKYTTTIIAEKTHFVSSVYMRELATQVASEGKAEQEGSVEKTAPKVEKAPEKKVEEKQNVPIIDEDDPDFDPFNLANFGVEKAKPEPEIDFNNLWK